MTATAVLIGAGHRGRRTYGDWARRHPERLRFVAVADPDPERRALFAAEHGLAEPAVHADWRPLLAAPRGARVAVIATGDTEHAEPACAALAAGYDVLLEKPIALSAAECVDVFAAAERSERLLQIAHPLRFTRFYSRAHAIVASGEMASRCTSTCASTWPPGT